MNRRTKEILNAVVGPETKVVSFDVFDTLVVRPVCAPTDLFKIVAKRTHFSDCYKEMRMMAERSARTKKPFYEDDVSLDDIYREFALLYAVSQSDLEVLKQAELQVELDYLYARETVKEIFNAAKNANKEIIITSDMYLPKAFLEEVLHKNGYSGYAKFYLSCEEKVAKGTGRLFKKIVADYELRGISPNEIVHIGDNKRADIDQAKSHKLRAFHTPSPISIFNSKKGLASLSRNINQTDNTFLVGFIANMLFDDPYHPFDINSSFGNELKNMGAVMFGPLLTAFTKWMLEDAISRKIDTISFVYRDGYIPIEIYSRLSECYPEAPKSNVIYLSRAMRYNYFSKTPNGLYQSLIDLPPSQKMTVNEFIESRLLSHHSNEKEVLVDIFKKHGYRDGQAEIGEVQKYLPLLKEVEPYFIQNANRRVSEIDDYCLKTLGGIHRLGLFDVGYRGSVSRHLKDHLNMPNTGYHLFSLPFMENYSKTEYELKSFISYGFTTRTESQILHHLIEDVISVQEGSTLHAKIGESGIEFVRQNSGGDSKEISIIQENIICFAEQFIGKFQKDIRSMHFDGHLFFDFLTAFLRKPYPKDASLIKSIKFYDSSLISCESLNVYLDWYEKRTANLQTTSQQPSISSQRDSNTEAHPISVTKKLKDFMYPRLQKYGLLPYAKKTLSVIRRLRHIGSSENLPLSQNDAFIREIEKAISEIAPVGATSNQPVVLVAGHMVSFDKGVCHYLNQLSISMSEAKWILLSEATRASHERTREKVVFDFMIVPFMFGKEHYLPGLNFKVSSVIRKEIEKKPYLSYAVENLKKRHPDMGSGYPEVLVYYSEIYFERVLDVLKPNTVILWNKFHALHHVWYHKCIEKNIKTLFMEFGVLPGSITIEKMGQMGESFPSKDFEKFLTLEVSKNDLARADEVLEILRNSKLNRNIQPINNMKDLVLQKIDRKKPVIFYAGQNDFESGMFPYSEHTKAFHSPVFQSSDAAAIYLAQLAAKNKWNFIYKPHPLMFNLNSKLKESLPENVILVSDIDIHDVIDMSDLTITILSQTGYVSTIRQKPTLMLGYTQLRGKGCTYEAFRLEDVEATIKTAIQNGYTKKQAIAFRKHVAQLLKYYLFDDQTKKSTPIGLSLDKCLEFIKK